MVHICATFPPLFVVEKIFFHIVFKHVDIVHFVHFMSDASRLFHMFCPRLHGNLWHVFLYDQILIGPDLYLISIFELKDSEIFFIFDGRNLIFD